MRQLLQAAAVFLMVLAAPGKATAGDDRNAGTDVVVKTRDRMKLAATHWDESTAKAPGVVLLHMYRSDRFAWGDLITHLRARGIEVLAIDMRGHGDSAKQGHRDLGKKVEKRDAKLFAAMHEDAIAAVRWLAKEGDCDPKRIAVVGASVGCSVAIDSAVRYPEEIAAVACMTPGANYLGLDSLEHARSFPEDVPLLLLTHESEADVGSRAIHAALPSSSLVVYDLAYPGKSAAANPQPGWAHGTRMFSQMPLVEQTVASFVAARTGSKIDDVVLDGHVAAETGDGGPWTQATPLESGDGVEAWAYRVGRRVVFGGRVSADGTTALTVGMDTHFPKGTSPALSSNPEIGFPEVGAVVLAAGRFDWVEPIDSGKDSGNKDFVARTRPVVRVVATEGGGYEFEGEWITEYGDGRKGPVVPSKVRLAVLGRAEAPTRPREIAPGAVAMPLDWADQAVEVESR